MPRYDTHRALVTACLLLVLGACASPAVTTGNDTPPSITVDGITDGATYDQSVIAQIAITRGDYQALLDGLPYTSGTTIVAPGAHVLSVAAHDGTLSATAAIHFTIRAPGGGVLIIRMFDLGANDDGGGGDAILVTDSSAAGQVHVLIDAGPAGANAADPAFVSRKLAALHADTLSLMILTHAHSDHYGGMSPVLSAAHVKRFFYNGQVRTISSYNSVLSQARAVADSVIVVSALTGYDLGLSATPAHLTLLTPLSTYLATSTDDGDQLNDGSVGARLQLGTFSMLFTGDGEVEANNHWRSAFPTLVQGVSVLKVGHHGANNAIFDDGFSGTATWLGVTAPQVSILSSNGTTHPRINALATLLGRAGNRTFCTNVHGDITIRVSRAGDYTVSVARNASSQCVAGSGATT